MHITSLTVQGFKSYRDQTVVDPFSDGINVVVGRNGSGKSNFFSAIRFVLSDAYTSLSRQERQNLLHEGSSTTNTFSAYVELVFDNSDGRFPTGDSEVVLRRTIGAKKDEYALNRKTTAKGEVMSMLESAGFSRSNPYYIVPQGRITHITNMKDADRLELLKEVAGTNVYESRREESMKIIDETDAKRKKIEELLAYIDERLTELEEEKAELKEFQVADKDRRCLEYSIYSRELEAASETLQTIEEERAAEADEANRRRDDFQDREREVGRIERDLSETKQALSMLDLERKQAEADRREAVKARTQIECIVRDLEAARSSASDLRESLLADLEAVNQSVSQAETLLMEVTPEWEDAVGAEKAERDEMEDKVARCDALYAKQGRTGRFATKVERDTFLDAEADKVRTFLATREQREKDVTRKRDSAAETVEAATSKSSELRKQLDGRAEAMQQARTELEALRAEMNEASEQRKELWKEDSKLDQTVQHARSELTAAERALSSTMDKATANGLKAARRIAEELELDGFYGPLYELFTVSDAYRTAAEVTAGTSLFHMVVDNDNTASQILDAMMKQKAGRVTFMPLNRLRVKPVNYPQTDDAADDDDRVVPLISKLQLVNRDRDLKAFEQVFSRTLVCKHLQNGSPYVRSHGLSVITQEGDRIDRKGALTGGFHDLRRSRLDAIERTKLWTRRYDEASRRHGEVKRKIAELDQAVTRSTGRVSIAETKLRQAKEGRVSFAAEAMDLQRDEEQAVGRRDRLTREQTELAGDVKRLKASLEALVKERATAMSDALSAGETDELARLSAEVEQHKGALVSLTKTRAEAESRKSMLEIDLSENLRRRREELEVRIERLGEGGTTGLDEAGDDADMLDSRKTELGNLETSIETLVVRLDELEGEAEKATTKLQGLETQLEKSQTAQAEDGKNIAKQQKAVERYHARRRVAQQRKDECNGKIRELGVLPEEAFAKYTTTRMDKLFKLLHKANEVLKKYSHVNKKAFEQYNNFTKQREELINRQEELDKSYDSINDLIETLDQRKDEAIERTFKQVSAYFSEVFEKIVPAGRGRLIMQKRLDQDEADDAMDEDGADKDKRTRIESYTGVSIKVSFNSKSDEGLRIQQLSGGQKSVVALAIVFAIQKCDPAPFYLFDEIDANLDADRRTAIASMINELSENAQFIITTFRPELLVHADNHLGVIFDARKVSTIKQLTGDEAREFVDANERAGVQAPRT